MKAFIQLGKIGDILSILPILKLEHFGTPIPLVVAKEFASLLDGVSYVEPVIWKGDVSDVAGAVLFAKKRYSQVVVLQTFGNIPVQHTAPSFQHDQWRRADVLSYFESQTLSIDRRAEEREQALLTKLGITNQPYIVFGDHSISSPFFQKEELAAMLKAEFPNHRIIRLSEVRAERIYDLLALFHKAAALVTVETAHLHLSRASNVPTYALAASGWRGSAYSSRFAFFMRYVEWDTRKGELMDAMRGNLKPVKVEKVNTKQPYGYNLSHLEHGGFFHLCYRAHSNSWRTKLFLNEDELKLPERYKDYSVEDCRLFVFNGKLHGAYVMSTSIDGEFRCYVAYGAIDGDRIEHLQIQHPENNLLGMTKNFVPFVHDGQLHFIYGIKKQHQIVLRVEGSRVLSEYKSDAPTWAWGEIRGGCVIEHHGNLLRFFHSRVSYNDRSQRYFIGASIIENKPPFKTLAVSKKPVIAGDERYEPAARFWKSNVAIPYGVIKRGDKILLSYGRNDCECCVAELTEKDLNL
jgi:predicted GH43/DUF377 family glycosyl hydrolase